MLTMSKHISRVFPRNNMTNLPLYFSRLLTVSGVSALNAQRAYMIPRLIFTCNRLTFRKRLSTSNRTNSSWVSLNIVRQLIAVFHSEFCDAETSLFTNSISVDAAMANESECLSLIPFIHWPDTCRRLPFTLKYILFPFHESSCVRTLCAPTALRVSR